MQGVNICHYVLELNGIPLKDMGHSLLQKGVKQFCTALDLHIVKEFDHKFLPHGSSIVFILEESHIGLHSWPEHGYIHIDMVTCSEESEPLDVAVKKAQEIFKGNVIKAFEVEY